MSAFGHNGGPDWTDLEGSLKPEPAFFVEKPDGRKELSELDRQGWFVSFMRRTQPHITVFANVNAGKRGPKAANQARKEGLLPGVFDLTVAWDINDATKPGAPTIAFAEYKGYSAAGQAGKLTDAQIEWGNSMAAKGFPIACFFSGKSCLDWLISLGAPIRGRLAA